MNRPSFVSHLRPLEAILPPRQISRSVIGVVVCALALSACIAPVKPVPTQQSQEEAPPREIADTPKPVEPAPSDALPSAPSAPILPLPPIGVGQPIAPQGKDERPSEDEIPMVEAKPVVVAASRESYVVPNATSGTKTNTPIMETPLNVQVISQQVLQDQQVIRLEDALKNVSGVVLRTNTAGSGQLGGIYQNFFLRGFESSTFFRNGFRLQEGSASRGLANVESIEVLKGPAAILYGLVEPGGMVNVITKQPLATPYYALTQQFGSYSLYRTSLDATGPLTNDETLLYRFNMSYENSGSFRDLVDNKDVLFAPVLKWNLSPRTQVTFEMEYNRQRLGMDNGFVPFFNGQLLNVPISRNYGEYAPATTETIFGGFNWSHQFNDTWSVKHRFSVNQRTVNAPFWTRPFAAGSQGFLQGVLDDFGIAHPNLDALPDGSYVLREATASRITNNTYSSNLELIGHFDTLGLSHTVLLGGDYYRLDSKTRDRFGPDTNFGSYISLDNPVHPGTPLDPFTSSIASSARTDQYGLYIQDQIRLPYGVHLMGGIRYQSIRQTSSVQDDTGAITVEEPTTQDAVTPRAGIVWRPQDWLSLYVNYAESFGANSGRVFPGTPIPPTSARQYEGGIKTEFFGGRLRATLAYYNLTKTNVAVSDPLHPFPACGGGCSLAIGEIRSKGPELDIMGEILPGWNVIATWANTDIIVTKSNPDNEAVSSPLGETYAPGSRLANIPRNTASLWSTYTVQDSELKGVSFGGGGTFRDRQLAFDNNDLGTASFTVPGNVTADLMAGYSRQIGDAKVSVQLNVNNLLDQRYFNNMFTLNSLQGAWVDFGRPRMFLGSIRIEY